MRLRDILADAVGVIIVFALPYSVAMLAYALGGY